jgi:hypothetical protein
VLRYPLNVRSPQETRDLVKKIVATAIAAGAGLLAVPAVASAHTTGGPLTCKVSFVHHPENASPVWAYDDFTRFTKFTPNSAKTVWKVSFFDVGKFTTVPGTSSDSGDAIHAKVTGKFAGKGSFTVHSASAPVCAPGTNSTTSDWARHFFTGDVTVTLDTWHWDYRTCREHLAEDSVTGTTGHMAGLPCWVHRPHPKPTKTTPVPAPSQTVPAPTQTVPAGEAPVPTPVTSDLAVTG